MTRQFLDKLADRIDRAFSALAMPLACLAITASLVAAAWPGINP